MSPNSTNRAIFTKPLQLGLLLGIMAINSWTRAAEEFYLTNLRLVGEADPSQCTSYAPQLEWRYSQVADNYLVEIQLIGPSDTLWESGLITTDQTAFRLTGLGILEPGKRYQFQLRAKHPTLGWSPVEAVIFTMNTPPTTPDLLIPNSPIIRAYPILIQYKPAYDTNRR